VSKASQRRALRNYRDRLAERGMARFEVLGRAIDRALIRSLARRLAENDRDRRDRVRHAPTAIRGLTRSSPPALPRAGRIVGAARVVSGTPGDSAAG